MHRFTRRLTPSLAVSVVALVAALGGTAVAAGELTPTQAPDERQYLKVRSTFKGELIGARNDGTVTRVGAGHYVVRFPSLLPGPRGSSPIAECAVTATARMNPNPVNTTTMTVALLPEDYNAVQVYSTKPHHDIVGEFKFQDVTFDLVAIC